jgi:peptidyl-tRNA hydrolase
LVRDAGFTEIAPGTTVAVEGYERVGALTDQVRRSAAD